MDERAATKSAKLLRKITKSPKKSKSDSFIVTPNHHTPRAARKRGMSSWHTHGGGLNRSSTRRMHPPGGRSSFGIGVSALSGGGGGGGSGFTRRSRERGPPGRRSSSRGDPSPARMAADLMMGGGRSDARYRGQSSGGGTSQMQFGGGSWGSTADRAGPKGSIRGAASYTLSGSGSGGPPVGATGYRPVQEAITPSYEEYFASKRSSTRRIAPPGGRSTLDLGGYPEPTSARRGKEQAARRADQDRFLDRFANPETKSSTRAPQPRRVASDSYGIGGGRGSKPSARPESYGIGGRGSQTSSRSSTRRIAPPGGSSSLSLGWNNDPSRYVKIGSPTVRGGGNRGRRGGQRRPGPAPEGGRPPRHPQRAPARRDTPPRRRGDPAPSRRGGSSSPWNRPNAISSNAYASGLRQNSGNFITDRSSTRLHAPPGGKSTLSLGWGGPQ